MDKVAPPPSTARIQHRSASHDRSRMSLASDDISMMKQVEATHSPDGRSVDINPILIVIETVFRHAAPSIHDGLNGKHGEESAIIEEKATLASFDGILEAVAYTVHRISCEIACKCTTGGGGDAHGTTMAILNMLSTYSWDAKVVLALAAFAVNYGEFSLTAKLYTTNLLAKAVSLLKQLPDILEHSNSLKPQFDALNNLINAMLEVTKCIIMFRHLPPQYISPEVPPLSVAMTHVPTATYWTIRSIVACASQITSLIGLGHEYMPSTTEAWELSSLAYKVNSIHDHLKKQLVLCHQHINEKTYVEAYQNLVRLFEQYHVDNLRILKTLIYAKEDILPLFDGTSKTRVGLDVLRKKTVLFLISDLDISHEEILILDQLYKESRGRPEMHYEIVWLPIIDIHPRSPNELTEELQQKFIHLQSSMPWHSIYHPSIIEPYVIKYIKEAWHFTKRMIVVALDPQAKVVNLNAVHMMWIWGNAAYPFTKEKEELLWNKETWRLELIVDAFDANILQWMTDGKYVCLYGGDDVEWIRKFTTAARSVAKTAGITLEMAYVGKSNAKERVRKTITAISQEKLSYCWEEPTLFWYFWTRLESMLYSKLQHGRTIENDQIMQEVMTILSYDGSDQGWTIFCRGPKEMVRANGDHALNSMSDFPKWQDAAVQDGFVPALGGHLQKLQTPHHCSRLILPGIAAGIPERVICAECRRPMEKFIMYRCCIE